MSANFIAQINAKTYSLSNLCVLWKSLYLIYLCRVNVRNQIHWYSWKLFEYSLPRNVCTSTNEYWAHFNYRFTPCHKRYSTVTHFPNNTYRLVENCCFYKNITCPGPSSKFGLGFRTNTENNRWCRMALGHLGQFNKIDCDRRPHNVPSNHILISGQFFCLSLCIDLQLTCKCDSVG